MKKARSEATSGEFLKLHGLKITTTRTDVLDTLRDAHKPMTAEMLQVLLGAKVNPATTYRTLQIFVEKGLVYQTNFRDGKAYYEYQDHHHHHVICTQCGIKEETNVCLDTKKLARSLENFKTLNSHILEFFGVCKTCSRD